MQGKDNETMNFSKQKRKNINLPSFDELYKEPQKKQKSNEVVKQQLSQQQETKQNVADKPIIKQVASQSPVIYQNVIDQRKVQEQQHNYYDINQANFQNWKSEQTMQRSIHEDQVLTKSAWRQIKQTSQNSKNWINSFNQTLTSQKSQSQNTRKNGKKKQK